MFLGEKASYEVIGTQYALEIEERREVYELAKC